MTEYNEKLCNEKHKQVDDKLEVHDRRLNSHADEIKELKISDSKHDEQILTVIKKIDEIIAQNRWFIGIVIVQLLGFFFLVIEKVAFK